jgi:D-serine deaminase-like pyridoxal phosphate-dependent protein
MVTTWWLLLRVSPQMLKKLSRVKLKLAPHKKTPKLTLMLKELRCEGVEFIALERIFHKDFLAHLRHHTFRDTERVSQ